MLQKYDINHVIFLNRVKKEGEDETNEKNTPNRAEYKLLGKT